jgi:DNA-damage-inducible protein D
VLGKWTQKNSLTDDVLADIIRFAMSHAITPLESIRRTNPAGNAFWSSRDFAKVLGYVNHRHFEAVISKAKTACINSDQRREDHFVGSEQMVEIGSGAQRRLKTVMMSR